MNILASHTLVIPEAQLAVLPNYSVAQERTETAVIAPMSTPGQAGAITSQPGKNVS